MFTCEASLKESNLFPLWSKQQKWKYCNNVQGFAKTGDTPELQVLYTYRPPVMMRFIGLFNGRLET